MYAIRSYYEQEAQEKPPVAEEPIATALRMDLVRLELGYGLLSLINEGANKRLTDQIKALRRALASEIGFIMPSVRIQDNMQLDANSYGIYIKEVLAGDGELRPNMLFRITSYNVCYTKLLRMELELTLNHLERKKLLTMRFQKLLQTKFVAQVS